MKSICLFIIEVDRFLLNPLLLRMKIYRAQSRDRHPVEIFRTETALRAMDPIEKSHRHRRWTVAVPVVNKNTRSNAP